MADEKNFKLRIIAPDRVFFEGEASFLELVTSEGEVGIYKNHIPMTMVLVPGIVRITQEDGIKIAALHSGFIQILQEEITILAEIVEWPDEIDKKRAEEAKIRAERRLEMKDPNINLKRAEVALRKSLVRIEAVNK